MHFQDTDALILPFSASLETLKAFKSAIENLHPPEQPADEAVKEPSTTTTKEVRNDIVCGGDICLDVSKIRPLMGFTRNEPMTFVPATLPLPRNVST